MLLVLGASNPCFQRIETRGKRRDILDFRIGHVDLRYHRFVDALAVCITTLPGTRRRRIWADRFDDDRTSRDLGSRADDESRR